MNNELKCRKIESSGITLEEYIEQDKQAFEDFKSHISDSQITEYMNDYNIEDYEKAKQYLAEYLYFCYNDLGDEPIE